MGCRFESDPGSFLIVQSRAPTVSRQFLDQLRAPRRPVVLARPGADRAGPRPAGSPSIRLTVSRSVAAPINRHGSINPAPDHATRAAFSAMSPTAGQQSTARPR